MKTVRESVDVLIAGGGTAGHVAALQAGRAGALTSVIESGAMLGGTMTAGGVNMPNHFSSRHGPVVRGIAWELFVKSKEVEGLSVPDYRERRPVETPGCYSYSYINIPIYAAIAEEEAIEAGVILHYHEFIAESEADGDFWKVVSLGRGIRRITRAREIIDCTGDCDVVRGLGLGVLRDDVRQPGGYLYKIEGIEHEQIWEKEVQALYEEAMAEGVLRKGDFAYADSLPFKSYLDHGGRNATHIHEADAFDADGQTRANLEGRVLRMFKFIRSRIPGCERAVLKTMHPHGLARETFRAEGEYIVTREDFLRATDFDDTICNAFNYIDMHSESKGCELFFHASDKLIPKVPFRALIPKKSSRITVAGRIVSAERMALAGIRAQCTCMAMGQAMGAAAALAVKKGIPSREVGAKNIVALTVEHGAVDVGR